MARSAETVKQRKRVRQLRQVNRGRRKRKQTLYNLNDLDKMDAESRRNRKITEAKEVGGCMVPECERKHHAKGLCSKHYKQFRRSNGSFDPANRQIVEV